MTLVIVGLAATGATTALFTDEETSTGNTFTAGAIDLTIDNSSYYNGVAVASSTWLQSDLDDGNGPSGNGAYLFYNFDDLKPGDWGEGTISFHVDNNDSWLCADVTLTSNDDNGINEPEGEDGDVTPGVGEGELADAVTFFWWADDGDNVLEDDETVLNTGTLAGLTLGEAVTVPLADSTINIWEGAGPLPGDEVRYAANAFCFGDLTLSPVAQDGSGTSTDPTVDPGFSCNGAPIDNITQTDSMTADLTFRAVQSRNNDEYVCQPEEPEAATLTVNKVVDNAAGGFLTAADFDLFIDGATTTNGVATEVATGTSLQVSESSTASSSSSYIAAFSGDCNASGIVSVSDGEQASCTITNTYVAETATATVDKIVTFSNQTLNVNVGDFDLFIDDGNGPIQLTDEVAMGGLAPGTYTVSEVYTGGESITIDAQFTGDCTDDGSTGTLILGEGDDLTCTITNVISELVT